MLPPVTAGIQHLGMSISNHVRYRKRNENKDIIQPFRPFSVTVQDPCETAANKFSELRAGKYGNLKPASADGANKVRAGDHMRGGSPAI